MTDEEKAEIVKVIVQALDIDLDSLFKNIYNWEKSSCCIVNYDCHTLAEAQRAKSIWDKFCILCNREEAKREIYKFKNLNGTFTYRFVPLMYLTDCKLDKDGCYVDKEGD